jgi:uncharacterized protein YbjT (DUF2867 family)
MVLVVGATGLVGSEVCRRLLQRGERVRALVRRLSSQNKAASLASWGAEVYVGDLKDADSIAGACDGANAVISTASSTLSAQPGDSIESVDRDGQLALVDAAAKANVQRFVFVSFRRRPDLSFPLADAKAAVEKALTRVNFTIIQASYFMEVWLSPALGFDYAKATARIYGDGTRPISWVSFADVAEMCATALHHPDASRAVIEFGGPESLSAVEAVDCFERIGGRRFKVDHVPESALRSQYEAASDSMAKTFAGLMLGAAHGDAIDPAPVKQAFGLQLRTVEDYARGVLGKAASAS